VRKARAEDVEIEGTDLTRCAEPTVRNGCDAILFGVNGGPDDIVLSDDRLLGARAFANKIWNAARFLFMNLESLTERRRQLEELAAPEVRAPLRIPCERSLLTNGFRTASRHDRGANKAGDLLLSRALSRFTNFSGAIFAIVH